MFLRRHCLLVCFSGNGCPIDIFYWLRLVALIRDVGSLNIELTSIRVMGKQRSFVKAIGFILSEEERRASCISSSC